MLNHLYTRHTSNSLLSLKSESKERKQRLLFDEGICILICFAGTAISSLGREGKRKLDRQRYITKVPMITLFTKKGCHSGLLLIEKSEFKLSPYG